jgi:hypothetical protein
MSYFLIIISSVANFFVLHKIIQGAKERFREQDERMKLLENEFLSIYKKMKTKDD